MADTVVVVVGIIYGDGSLIRLLVVPAATVVDEVRLSTEAMP